MAKTPKNEICPECGGMNTLCSHPDYDGDHCPDDKEDCDEPCDHLIDCPTCKGGGMVTFAVMNRYIKKMSAITWGKGVS